MLSLYSNCVFLKKEHNSIRIGQIIFDPNGEYANENIQDKDGGGNPNALKIYGDKILNLKRSQMT